MTSLFSYDILKIARTRARCKISKEQSRRGGFEKTMTLCEELYFEITVSGAKSDIKKFLSFIRSGELDEFFEMDSDYIDYRDGYEEQGDSEITGFTLSNDDYGIEIEEFDTDEFLDVFCMAGRALDIHGRLFDVDDEEYAFVSHAGDSYYLNAKKMGLFNEDGDDAVFSND